MTYAILGVAIELYLQGSTKALTSDSREQKKT